jgi:hypothetical protein
VVQPQMRVSTTSTLSTVMRPDRPESGVVEESVAPTSC